MFLLLLSSVLSMVMGSCEKTNEVSVHQIKGSVNTFTPQDSVLIGRINDIERSGDRYYMVDDHSRIYLLDSNLKLLRYRNVDGRGPGEIGIGNAIEAHDCGFMIFDSENMKFVLYNDSLKFIREFQASELYPFSRFSFLVKDSKIYTAYNSVHALITTIDIGSVESKHYHNGAVSTKIGSDLSFFEDTHRSTSRDNLYGIHKYGDKILLVSRLKPLILVFNHENGTYKLTKQYSFSNINYFKDLIQSNEDFHRREENIYSWKTFVTDAEVYNNKLILLINIEKPGYKFFSHILIINLEGNNFIPKQIYQLGLEGEGMPWIRMFTITEEGNLLCVVAGRSGLMSYDLNLNE